MTNHKIGLENGTQTPLQGSFFMLYYTHTHKLLMSERAQNLMDQIWNIRYLNPDMTEKELVSSVLQLAVEHIQSYNAQNDMIVLDKNDMLQLAEELK